MWSAARLVLGGCRFSYTSSFVQVVGVLECYVVSSVLLSDCCHYCQWLNTARRTGKSLGVQC